MWSVGDQVKRATSHSMMKKISVPKIVFNEYAIQDLEHMGEVIARSCQYLSSKKVKNEIGFTQTKY